MKLRKSLIDVLGAGWPAYPMATTYTLTDHDVAYCYDDGTPGRPPAISRESVQRWLDTHAGDFSRIDDFWASLETAEGETVEIGWADDDNGFTYNGIMWPEEGRPGRMTEDHLQPAQFMTLDELKGMHSIMGEGTVGDWLPAIRSHMETQPMTYAHVRESLRTKGQTEPLQAWNGTLSDGHHRVAIADEMGMPGMHVEHHTL